MPTPTPSRILNLMLALDTHIRQSSPNSPVTDKLTLRFLFTHIRPNNQSLPVSILDEFVPSIGLHTDMSFPRELLITLWMLNEGMKELLMQLTDQNLQRSIRSILIAAVDYWELEGKENKLVGDDGRVLELVKNLAKMGFDWKRQREVQERDLLEAQMESVELALKDEEREKRVPVEGDALCGLWGWLGVISRYLDEILAKEESKVELREFVRTMEEKGASSL